MKLALTLLLLLAVASLLGTILPQEQSSAFYAERFGPQLSWLIGKLDLHQVYRSSWFLALISLLLFNLLACSLERLPQAWRRWVGPVDPEKFQTLPERLRLHWRRQGENSPTVLEGDLHEVLGATRRQEAGEATWFFRFSGRWGVWGPYIIHASIILIILGGLIGKIYGVKGNLYLHEGETGQVLQVPGLHSGIPLDFAVHLDDFQVDFYPDGMPKEYRSDLTFLQGGREAAKFVCRVNHPVEFGGFTFYQSTYQTALAGPARLEVDFQGKKTILEALPRQKIMLPDGGGAIMLLRADGNIQGHGPAVQLAYQMGRGHPAVFWVLQNQPQSAGHQPGPHRFSLSGLDFRYSSGLMVKKDPGVWWVYLGFILLLPGFWLAFFTPRQRWAVCLRPDGRKGWLLTVHGAGDRHREAFEGRLERLRRKLEERA